MALRPCARPGCPDLVDSGYCDHHQQRDRYRGNSNARGYDAAWRRFRSWYIRAFVAPDPRCQDCGGMFDAAKGWSDVELHHVEKVADRPDLKLTPSNIRHLCKACHTARTGRGE
jgi:5-methylcytosine-specific restriction enzyme A